MKGSVKRSRRRLQAEDEAMPGGVVWVCEHGHVDQLHKVEGNYLDLCATCRDGVCEPRPTLGRRSQLQRERDRDLAEMFPVFAEMLRKGHREQPPVVPSEVMISKLGEEPVVVSAEALAPTANPPFGLSAEHRQQILSREEKLPGITFRRERPTELEPDAQWPPGNRGDVVPVTDSVVLVVLGHRTRVDSYVLLYEVRDRRLPQADPIKAFKPLDQSTNLTGQQFRGEPEPEQMPRAEVTKMAERVHRAELEKLRRIRDQHGASLKELAGSPRDVRWSIGKTIEVLNLRIAELERRVPSAAAA
ncbi:MAG TPA: hypothetical protein VFK14_00275 [Solirubrobacterales bacterium]|nr:hypothetical protein [Solirubrobacterales bacterium]